MRKISITEIRKELKGMNKIYGTDYDVYEVKGGRVNQYGYRLGRDIRITASKKSDLEKLQSVEDYISPIEEVMADTYHENKYVIRVRV